jgi:DNA replication initiation complex subunit (GINS family)
MDEIKITLESLYDILRNEKKKEDLQKLSPTFFIDVVSYLREKKALLGEQTQSREIFAVTEREKLEYELRSIKRILKEIYEKREKKIIDITLNKNRTGSDIIDTSSMLREEKEYYEHLLFLFDTYRQGVLLKLFSGEVPFIEKIQNPLSMQPISHLQESLDSPVEEGSEGEENQSKNSFSEFEGVEKKVEDTPLMTTIKFLRAVPRFIWKDMKEYGPYGEGEETEIFEEVADLLVRKGRAQKV